jgi:hypothetical protein
MNEESSLQPQTINQNSSTEIVQNTQQSVEETKQAEIDSKIESLAEFEKPKVDVGKVKTDEKKKLIIKVKLLQKVVQKEESLIKCRLKIQLLKLKMIN